MHGAAAAAPQEPAPCHPPPLLGLLLARGCEGRWSAPAQRPSSDIQINETRTGRPSGPPTPLCPSRSFRPVASPLIINAPLQLPLLPSIASLPAVPSPARRSAACPRKCARPTVQPKTLSILSLPIASLSLSLSLHGGPRMVTPARHAHARVFASPGPQHLPLLVPSPPPAPPARCCCCQQRRRRRGGGCSLLAAAASLP